MKEFLKIYLSNLIIALLISGENALNIPRLGFRSSLSLPGYVNSIHFFCWPTSLIKLNSNWHLDNSQMQPKNFFPSFNSITQLKSKLNACLVTGFKWLIYDFMVCRRKPSTYRRLSTLSHPIPTTSQKCHIIWCT